MFASRKWEERDIESGFCSHCVTWTEHTRQETSWLPGIWRSAYKCSSCGQRTLACINDCGAAAKGDWYWDDHFCLQCEGTIVSWPSHGVSHWPAGSSSRSADPVLHRGGEGRISSDEAIAAAMSGFELLMDCLASPAADTELMASVASSVEDSKKQLENVINRTENEDALQRLLEMHTNLDRALMQYADRAPASRPEVTGADGEQDFQGPRGSLAAAESRASQQASRGKAAPKPRPSPAGAEDIDQKQNRGALPEEKAAVAAPARSTWSDEARQQFATSMQDSVSITMNAPVAAPSLVCAPALLLQAAAVDDGEES